MGCSSSSFLTAVNDGCSVIPSKAMVVAVDGSLLEYSGGICAAEVIIAVGQVYALCNSDKLFFDAYPPAMAPDEVLVPGQLYFFLPAAELNQRLSGANVAALAIRASAAMKQAAEKRGRRRIRIAPVMEVFYGEHGESGGNLDLRLPTMTTEMKKTKGTMGTWSKGSRRVLTTIEEVEEESICGLL